MIVDEWDRIEPRVSETSIRELWDRDPDIREWVGSWISRDTTDLTISTTEGIDIIIPSTDITLLIIDRPNATIGSCGLDDPISTKSR